MAERTQEVGMGEREQVDIDSVVDAIMVAATQIMAARESGRAEHLASLTANNLARAAGRVCALSAQLERYREATRAFVAWLEAEKTSPDYGSLTRDTHPEGERIWREYWDRNIRLCERALSLGVGALDNDS